LIDEVILNGNPDQSSFREYVKLLETFKMENLYSRNDKEVFRSIFRCLPDQYRGIFEIGKDKDILIREKTTGLADKDINSSMVLAYGSSLPLVFEKSVGSFKASAIMWSDEHKTSILSPVTSVMHGTKWNRITIFAKGNVSYSKAPKDQNGLDIILQHPENRLYVYEPVLKSRWTKFGTQITGYASDIYNQFQPFKSLGFYDQQEMVKNVNETLAAESEDPKSSFSKFICSKLAGLYGITDNAFFKRLFEALVGSYREVLKALLIGDKIFIRTVIVGDIMKIIYDENSRAAYLIPSIVMSQMIACSIELMMTYIELYIRARRHKSMSSMKEEDISEAFSKLSIDEPLKAVESYKSRSSVTAMVMAIMNSAIIRESIIMNSSNDKVAKFGAFDYDILSVTSTEALRITENLFPSAIKSSHRSLKELFEKVLKDIPKEISSNIHGNIFTKMKPFGQLPNTVNEGIVVCVNPTRNSPKWPMAIKVGNSKEHFILRFTVFENTNGQIGMLSRIKISADSLWVEIMYPDARSPPPIPRQLIKTTVKEILKKSKEVLYFYEDESILKKEPDGSNDEVKPK